MRWRRFRAVFMGVLVVSAFCALARAEGPSQKNGAASAPSVSELYSENCELCHGADGRGASDLPGLPNLASPELYKPRNKSRLYDAIANGRGAMPGFRAALRPAQIRKLVLHIREFARAPRAESAGPAAGVNGEPGPRQKEGGGLIERALEGRARIIDLTHPLGPQTPAFSGEKNLFRYEKLAEMGRDGYAAGAVRVPEHFGTHVDAPGHFINGRETVEQIDPKRLIVPAAVIDARPKAQADPDYRLTVADIRAWERGGAIPEGAAVLLLTGWDKRYGDADRYRNADAEGVMHFPGFSDEAIKYLVSERKVVALGIDTLSIDYGPSKDFSAHKLSHASGLYHIENMANLDQLPPRGAVIFVGPLAIQGGSGSPARVLAIAP